MSLFTSLRFSDVLGAAALPGLAPARALVSGNAPDSALTFFASPKKVSKERRAGFVDPLRGHAALFGLSGVRANSLRSNMRAPFSAQPCATRLLITAGGAGYQIPIQQGRAMARPCGVRMLGSRLSGPLCRVAGLSSAAAGGSGRALFERSEFSPTPPDASSARNPAGALTSAALLFGDFLLGTQEKVTALSGAHPDKASHARATPKARSLPGAHPGNVTPAGHHANTKGQTC